MTVRAVLDTNVVVSALLKPQGLEDRVLRLGFFGRLRLCLSPAILDEYADVLPRPRLKLQPEEITRILKEIRKSGKLVHPTHAITVCPDEADNRFLECAEAARADFLITGNTKHFPKQWKTTMVVNAREFLANNLRLQ